MLSDHSIAIIMLAAGRGERMGDTGAHPSKLFMPLRDGQPIVAHALRNAATLGPSEMVVVVQPDTMLDFGSEDEQIPNRLVRNPRFAEGMGTSLAAGVAALGDNSQAALAMLADMPFVPTSIVDALVAAYLRERKAVTIPVYGDAVGPPTLFSCEAFPDLVNLEGEAGGRQLLGLYPPDRVCRVPFQAEDRPPDIDTPEDLNEIMNYEF
jgi:molybdenum cofactor cytidylyltransferase